jgi:hypothetical protein
MQTIVVFDGTLVIGFYIHLEVRGLVAMVALGEVAAILLNLPLMAKSAVADDS